MFAEPVGDQPRDFFEFAGFLKKCVA